jgi:hypothetical protein
MRSLFRIPALMLALLVFTIATALGAPAAFAFAPSASVIFLPGKVNTYSVTFTGLAPAASATDIFALTGSSTLRVMVRRAYCTGLSTAAGTNLIVGIVRTTPDSAGTALTPVAAQQSNQAATAVPNDFTANPTLGTSAGSVFAVTLTTGTTTAAPSPMNWEPADDSRQPITLVGTSQQFVLNAAGVSFPSGAAISCTVVWTEQP